MMGTERGYTIIEVMLFLAISSALFLVAFAYTNNTIQNTGFTDDTNQLAKFIERTYLNVKNSQSTRDDSTTGVCNTTDTARIPGASDTCSVIGTALYFDRDNQNVIVSTVVGNVAPVASATTDLAALRSLNPRVLSDGVNITVNQRFPSPARLEMAAETVRYKPGLSVAKANTIAFLRSPVSEKVFVVSWDATGNGTQAATYNASPGSLTDRLTDSSAYVDKPVVICYQNSDSTQRYAAVQIATGQVTGNGVIRGEAISRVGMACG